MFSLYTARLQYFFLGITAAFAQISKDSPQENIDYDVVELSTNNKLSFK